jgi:hypothetical protein
MEQPIGRGHAQGAPEAERGLVYSRAGNKAVAYGARRPMD